MSAAWLLVLAPLVLCLWVAVEYWIAPLWDEDDES